MLFIDTNSYIFHRSLNSEIDQLIQTTMKPSLERNFLWKKRVKKFIY